MASAELSRRVKKVVGDSPPSDMGKLQRSEFHEALLEADGFEDLPGRWQAAIMEEELHLRLRSYRRPATDAAATV